MGITPAQLEIPALESRFVLLSFAPAAVRAYAACLELSVAGGNGVTDFKCEVSRCCKAYYVMTATRIGHHSMQGNQAVDLKT